MLCYICHCTSSGEQTTWYLPSTRNRDFQEERGKSCRASSFGKRGTNLKPNHVFEIAYSTQNMVISPLQVRAVYNKV
jgi:hypothetical protein